MEALKCHKQAFIFVLTLQVKHILIALLLSKVYNPNPSYQHILNTSHFQHSMLSHDGPWCQFIKKAVKPHLLPNLKVM